MSKIIQVYVKPRSRYNKVIQTKEGITVMTTAPAKDGKANNSMIKLVAEFLDVAKSAIKIKTGHSSKIKLIEISDYEENKRN